jgi:phosphatidylethanolamine/phosphatidyl-N-methylethanolamine N-methyltransferase
MHASGVTGAYRRWSSIYDLVWGPILSPGLEAVAARCPAGGRILEIGIGTGLSLAFHDPASEIVGIDLSAEMLARADARRRRSRPRRVALARMDACRLAFADASFDAVALPFVITLVADPGRVMAESLRVLRPGGDLLVASHFASPNPAVAGIERALAPGMARLGLRPDCPLSIVAHCADGRADVSLLECRPLAPLGLFTLVRLRRLPAEAAPAARPADAVASA